MVELVYIHPAVRLPTHPNDDFYTLLELNSFLELQRFGHLEPFTSTIRLDYEEVRGLVVPDRAVPYTRRWRGSGIIII